MRSRVCTVIGRAYSQAMRIQQLRYLETALREGSVRRAAQRLDISQPSLSQQLQRLEEELDLVLLVRTRSGVRPTESATRLLPYVRRLLAAERTLVEEASAIRGLQTGYVRVGAVPTAIRVLLHELIPAFRSALPNVSIELWESDSASVSRRVAAGTLDLGVIGILPGERPSWLEGLSTVDLCHESLVLCVPRGHRLQNGEIDVGDLAREPWISYGSGFVFAATSQLLFPADPPQPVFHTNDTTTAMIMVGAGVGLAFLPRSAVVHPPTDQIVLRADLGPGVSTPEIVLNLVRRADMPSPPSARQFTAMLRRRAAAVTSAP
jgi:LysR family transcriptional regulator, hydrogen peroxide-inducible genes activator